MAARGAGLMSTETKVILGAGALLVLWVWIKGVGGVAQTVTQGAVNAATGAAAGVVVGVGQAVGIPQTSQTKCQKALAAGDTWTASFECPAGQFLGSVF